MSNFQGGHEFDAVRWTISACQGPFLLLISSCTSVSYFPANTIQFHLFFQRMSIQASFGSRSLSVFSPKYLENFDATIKLLSCDSKIMGLSHRNNFFQSTIKPYIIDLPVKEIFVCYPIPLSLYLEHLFHQHILPIL